MMGLRWNVEGYGGKWAAPNLQVLLKICMEEMRKASKTSIRVVGLLSETCPGNPTLILYYKIREF
jgi:hypothetical protein